MKQSRFTRFAWLVPVLLLAFAMAFPFLNATASDAIVLAAAQKARSQAIVSRPTPVPTGFIEVNQLNWRQSGSPPRLEFCLGKTLKSQGFFSNEYACEKWVSPRVYMQEKFPGAGLEITGLEYQCSIYQVVTGKTVGRACNPKIVVYYRAPPF